VERCRHGEAVGPCCSSPGREGHNKPLVTRAAFLPLLRKEEFLTEAAPCNKNLASLFSSAVKAKDLSRQSPPAI